jgi:hypothetical protein
MTESKKPEQCGSPSGYSLSPKTNKIVSTNAMPVANSGREVEHGIGTTKFICSRFLCGMARRTIHPTA